MQDIQEQDPHAIAHAALFLRNITPDDKVALFHDTDPDGMCAAVLLAHIIKKLHGKPVDLRLNGEQSNYEYFEKELPIQLRNHNITVLLSVDIALEQKPETLKQLLPTTKILEIDHHIITHAITHPKYTLLKPQLFSNKNPSGYCTAKLVYDLGNELFDMHDKDWLAAVGLIGDIGFREWGDWIKAILKKYTIPYTITKEKDWFENKLGEVAKYLSSAESYDIRNVPEIFTVLSNATTYEDILTSPLKKYYDAINKELQEHTHAFSNNHEKKNDLLFFEIRPRHVSGSIFSTICALKYPNNTVVIVEQKKDILKISARRNDGTISVAELLKKSTQGLVNANAGGHIQAAGGTIQLKDYPKFKEKLFSLI